MPTNHYAFKLLPLQQQLAIVWAEGSYLAKRWEEEDTVALYHLGTFFCEVYYDDETNHIHRTRTFTSVNCLVDYTHYIKLGDLLS